MKKRRNQTRKVVFDTSALLSMLLCGVEVFPTETYGALLGYEKANVVHVAAIIPYQKAKRQRRQVTVDFKHYEKIQKILDTHLDFFKPFIKVGEWHTHPDTSPAPSVDDKQTLKTNSVNIILGLRKSKKGSRKKTWRQRKQYFSGTFGEFFCELNSFYKPFESHVRKIKRCPIICRGFLKQLEEE